MNTALVERVFGSQEAFYGRHTHGQGITPEHLAAHTQFEKALDTWGDTYGTVWLLGHSEEMAVDKKDHWIQPEFAAHLVDVPKQLTQALELYVRAHTSVETK